MPTTRPRHSITETEDVERALGIAARAWPELRDDRPALLRKLIARGADVAESAVEQAIAARIAAVRATAGVASALYESDELALLRAEWPE